MAEYLGANESHYRHQTRTRSSVRSSDKTVSLKTKINSTHSKSGVGRQILAAGL